jgi:hypothetical protein
MHFLLVFYQTYQQSWRLLQLIFCAAAAALSVCHSLDAFVALAPAGTSCRANDGINRFDVR